MVQALIANLVTDIMVDGDIDGIADKQGKTLNLHQAINNFKTGSGENNPVLDTGNSNAGTAMIVTAAPSVILSTTAAALSESGTSTYTVVLNTQPTGNVTFTPTSDDVGAATVSPAMTFTTANWNTPQTVTVTGVADDDAANESVTITHTVAGADYASVTSNNVAATVTDDDLPFTTLTLGSQTWSASNVSSVPTINNVLGTDYWTTYDGSGGSATDNDGYYYSWDAAMNVCPSGWSLPSDSDWKVLEGHIGMSGSDQDATGWRGTNQGTQLKVDGTSGFEAKLAGYSTSGNAFNRGVYAHLWTSTESGGDAHRRLLRTSNATVYRNTTWKSLGLSVRCLKD